MDNIETPEETVAMLVAEIDELAYDQLIDQDDGWKIRRMIGIMVQAAKHRLQRILLNKLMEKDHPEYHLPVD